MHIFTEGKTMLQRNIVSDISKWKEKKGNKCLVIRGARQIGKTYIVRFFGNTEYKAYYEINFLETPEYRKIFSGNLDPKTIMLNCSFNLISHRSTDKYTTNIRVIL